MELEKITLEEGVPAREYLRVGVNYSVIDRIHGGLNGKVLRMKDEYICLSLLKRELLS